MKEGERLVMVRRVRVPVIVSPEARRQILEQVLFIHYRVGDAAVDIVNFRHGARLPQRSEP